MAPRPTSWRDVATINPNQPRYRPGGLGRYRSSSPRRSSVSGGRRRRGGRQGGDDIDKVLDKLRRYKAADDDSGGLIDDIANVGKGVLKGTFAVLDTGRAGAVAIGSELGEGAIRAFDIGDEGKREQLRKSAEDAGETYGFSVADIVKKTRERKSTVEQTKWSDDPRYQNLPTAAKIGVGFAADIATDPLTYIAPQAKLDDVTKVARELDAAGEAGAAARVLKARTASVLTSDELAKIGATGGVYARVPGTGVVGRTLGIDRLLQKAGVPMHEAQLVSRESRLGRAGAAASRGLHKPIAGVLNSRPAQKLVRWGFAGSNPQLKAMLRSGDPESATQALWSITKDAEGRYVGHGFESRWGKELHGILKDARKANVEGRDLWLAPTGDPDAVLRAGESGARLTKWLDDVGLDANNLAGKEFLNIHEDYAPRFVQDEILDGIRRGDEKTVESIVKKRKYGTAPGEKPEFMGHELVSKEAHPKGWSVERQIDGILYQEGITSSPRRSGFYKDDAYEVMPLYLKKLARQVGREHTANELVKVGVGADLYKTMTGPRSLGGTRQRMELERKLSETRRAGQESDAAPELSEWATHLDEASDSHTQSVQTWLRDDRPDLTGTDAVVARTVAEQSAGEMSELLARHSQLMNHRDVLLREIEDHYGDAAAVGRNVDEGAVDELRSQLDGVEGLLDDMNATVAGIDLQSELSLRDELQTKLASLAPDSEQARIGASLLAAQESKIRAAQELVADPAGRAAVDSLKQERDEILDTIQSDLPEVEPAEKAVLDTSLGGEPLTPQGRSIRSQFEASTDPEEQVDLGVVGQVKHLEDQADAAVTELGPPMDAGKAVKALQGQEETVRRVLQTGFRQFGANTQLPEQVVESLTAAGRLGADWGGVLPLYDKVQNLWKAYAVATPGFHFRNSFGGFFNNWLAGVHDIKSYARYQRLARAAAKGELDKFPQDLQDAWRALEQSGVSGTGQTAYEIEHRLFAPLSVNPASTDFAPLRASRRIGEGVENNLRGTLFLDEFLRNGGDSTEAFAKVMKFHFDYEDLSALERSVIRRVVPFYTWTRRNLPLQLEMIAKQPAKMNRYWQAKQNIEATSEEEGVVPPYYEDLWAIRLPIGTPTEQGGEGQMYLTPDLPITQLGEVLDPGMLIGQTSPIIKTPIEYWASKQFFKDLPLSDEYEPAPGVYAAVPGLMEGMKLLGRAERNADGDWMLKERDAYALGSYIPLLSQARRLLPSEDRYEDRRWSSMLSYFFGVGTRTNTESEQRKVLWQRYYDLEDQLKEAESLGYVNTDPEADRVTVRDLVEQM